MPSRTDTIAAVLRQPVLRRPVLAHEMRGHLVQGVGPRSTETRWTATVPQLAEAIDAALQQGLKRGEKDTRGGIQPPAGESTARAEILAALQACGYSAAAAADLLARAFREPHAPSEHVFRETLAGGHALVVEFGDRELLGSCQCGRRLGRLLPARSVDQLAALWERHTCTELTTTYGGIR